MKARVVITPKPGVLDPEGRAVARALADLGYASVADVRTGKVVELEVAETDPAVARRLLDEMCDKLLANPVIETYTIELVEPGC